MNKSKKGADSAAGSAPGEDAQKPGDIPAKGWLQILKRGWKEASVDQVPLLAAGVAFFGFLSLFPAMIALVLVYGLIADPATVAQQVGTLTKSLPPGAGDLISGQLTTLTSTPPKSLGFGLVLSILIALWSASGGVGQLITAVNTAYDEEVKRGFVKQKLLALGMTLAAIVFMVLMIGLVAVAPVILENLVGSGPLRWLLAVAQYALLIILVMSALAVLYRFAPDRDAPKMRWVSTGAAIATVIWVLASIGFTIYVSSFGSYAKTYGALAGVVVLLLWLWITCYAILLGAEINAESEEQTAADTTKGPAEPIGQRGAVKADSTPAGKA
ncbi:MAG: YihY/virulence factor BrkB family protein [Propionibacteriaceae bacterium]|nr:YihY/virulence factor BrkB family protein [Propionibacteriaceae bacterium]